LRRFRAPEDRSAVLAGYCEDSPTSKEFMAVWRVGCAIADVAAIGFSQEIREAAAAELDKILG
jgi:hypothetical protein